MSVESSTNSSLKQQMSSNKPSCSQLPYTVNLFFFLAHVSVLLPQVLVPLVLLQALLSEGQCVQTLAHVGVRFLEENEAEFIIQQGGYVSYCHAAPFHCVFTQIYRQHNVHVQPSHGGMQSAHKMLQPSQNR